MQWNNDRIILANPDILSESHLPPEIHSRQSQLKETALCLRPLTESRKPVHCWFYGRPGVEKVGLICACNSQHVCYGLEERVKSRLNPVRLLFGEYNQDELFEILSQRALLTTAFE